MNLQGATTEVAALKKALSKAEDKAAKERTEQELQEALKKCETLEQSLTKKESELTKARQAHTMPGAKPKVPCRKSRRPERSRRVRLFLCKENI